MKEIAIGRKRIGAQHPCLIVAEMSGNHKHDFERAKDLVHAAADAGADAVKMQAYTADTITLDSDQPDFRIQKGNAWEAHGTLHKLYQQAYTPWEWFAPLTEEANKLGMEAFCSVFDASSVDYMESLGTCAYKIAGCEITDIPLLRYIGRLGKPVILSSGIATDTDLQLAIDTLRESGTQDIVALKCVSEYPTPIEQCNLRTMADIEQRFQCFSGLSDHSLGTTVPVAAVCVGARVVEKHFTLDKTQTVDSFFSLLPDELRSMVSEIRRAEAALGTVDYTLHAPEASRRSLYVSSDIAMGERFSEHNVRSVRPGLGLHPKYWDQVLASTAQRDMQAGQRLSLEDLQA